MADEISTGSTTGDAGDAYAGVDHVAGLSPEDQKELRAALSGATTPHQQKLLADYKAKLGIAIPPAKKQVNWEKEATTESYLEKARDSFRKATLPGLVPVDEQGEQVVETTAPIDLPLLLEHYPGLDPQSVLRETGVNLNGIPASIRDNLDMDSVGGYAIYTEALGVPANTASEALLRFTTEWVHLLKFENAEKEFRTWARGRLTPAQADKIIKGPGARFWQQAKGEQ